MFEAETLQKVRAIINWLNTGKIIDRCPTLSARDWLNIEQAMEDWHRIEWMQSTLRKQVVAEGPPPLLLGDSDVPAPPMVQHVSNEWAVRSDRLHLRAAIDAQAGKETRNKL